MFVNIQAEKGTKGGEKVSDKSNKSDRSDGESKNYVII